MTSTARLDAMEMLVAVQARMLEALSDVFARHPGPFNPVPCHC